jgi:hypothetical protein
MPDPQVVDGRDFAALGVAFHGNPLSVVAEQDVADLQIARWQPTETDYVERVFAGRTNQLTACMHIQNRRHAGKHFLNLLFLQGPLGIKLRTRK